MRLNNFNWLDYVFVGIYVVFIFHSLWRGFVKEIISILAWVTGFFLGFTYAPSLAALFSKSADAATAGSSAISPSTFAVGLSFVLLLVGALLVGAIINYFLGFVIEASGLGIFNRLLGGVLGFAKAFIIEVAIVFLVQTTSYADAPDWKQSEMVNAYQPAIILLENKFGSQLDDLKEKVGEIEKSKAVTEKTHP